MPAFLDLLLPAGVSLPIALVLIVVSFFTSALTAAFGIGGGVALLGAMAATVPPATIVAVHGVVQFGSNIGRTIVQRAHIVWRPVLLFVAGSVIGVGLGALVFTRLPTPLLLLLLGLFILFMAWVPKPKIPGIERQGMVLGGAVASIASMFVGAVGPFVQALLLPLGLEKRQLVATFSAMQTAQHLLKVVAFGAIGFAFGDWLPLMAAMIASGFLGTLWGTRLLERMSAAVFQTVLKWLLTVLALDLLRRAAIG
jgi:uncharacterized membrane protein YfcA